MPLSSKLFAKNKITYCPGCGELFIDPSSEDRIQCFQCNLWFHESCTDHRGRGKCVCITCV
jgi:hypothetical protein